MDKLKLEARPIWFVSLLGKGIFINGVPLLKASTRHY